MIYVCRIEFIQVIIKNPVYISLENNRGFNEGKGYNYVFK